MEVMWRRLVGGDVEEERWEMMWRWLVGGDVEEVGWR